MQKKPSKIKKSAEQTHEHIIEGVRRAGSSFYWGMRMLPLERRHAMYALYAFCRDVDDIADSSDTTKAKRLKGLQEWRKRIEDMYRGKSTHPITTMLSKPIRAYGLPKEEFIAIIEGMEMDVSGPLCGPDWKTLHLYCRRVAGAVGLLSTLIFGDSSKQAQNHALALGEAFQLTNILRDLAEDATRGRVYLPKELMMEHGGKMLKPKDVLAGGVRISLICDDVASVALKAFARSDMFYQRCRLRALRPARMMRHVYHDLLIRLVVRGWQDMTPLPKAGTLKLFIFALRSYFLLR